MEIEEAKEIIKDAFKPYRCGFEEAPYKYLGFKVFDGKTEIKKIVPFDLEEIKNVQSLKEQLEPHQREIESMGHPLG